jgi:hypothetical protein
VRAACLSVSSDGGGYQYRLAPADGPLTEETFGKIPLPFVGKQGLRWKGGPAHGGTEIFFNGTYVTEGTVPAGSAWSRNPIPRNDMHQTGEGFAPPCAAFGMDTSMCEGMEDGEGGAEPTLEIVDRVMIPKGLKPGPYVLGWRWGAYCITVYVYALCLCLSVSDLRVCATDCEESNQIWCVQCLLCPSTVCSLASSCCSCSLS